MFRQSALANNTESLNVKLNSTRVLEVELTRIELQDRYVLQIVPITVVTCDPRLIGHFAVT